MVGVLFAVNTVTQLVSDPSARPVTVTVMVHDAPPASEPFTKVIVVAVAV